MPGEFEEVEGFAFQLGAQVHGVEGVLGKLGEQRGGDPDQRNIIESLETQFNEGSPQEIRAGFIGA